MVRSRSSRFVAAALAVPLLCFGAGALAQPGSASLVNSTYLTTVSTDGINPQQFTLEARFRPDGPGYGLTGDIHGPVVVGKPRHGAAGNYIASWVIAWSPTTQRVVF